jgi:hypothetical protein
MKTKRLKLNRLWNCLTLLLFGFPLVLPLVTMGCAARVGVYDPAYRDYHRWDRDEDRAYHDYWRDRHEHEEYRDYNRLNADQQRDYWNWRHDHPDQGKRGDRDRDRH